MSAQNKQGHSPECLLEAAIAQGWLSSPEGLKAQKDVALKKVAKEMDLIYQQKEVQEAVSQTVAALVDLGYRLVPVDQDGNTDFDQLGWSHCSACGTPAKAAGE